MKSLGVAWGDVELFHLTVADLKVQKERAFVKEGENKFSRQGFPVEVMAEIDALIETHAAKF